MSLEDFTKPAGAALGLAALAAAGFAAGYVVARDPATLRRLVRAVAGGAERVSLALAETREELADLWAEAREDARAAVEEAAFATGEKPTVAASAAAAAATAADAGGSEAAQTAPPPGPKRRRAASTRQK
jgi:hypothetical protein